MTTRFALGTCPLGLPRNAIAAVVVLVLLLFLAGCGRVELASDGGAPPAAKRLFVTAATYGADLASIAGEFDGLAGGDRICNQAAAAAGLGGTWKAWLSSDSPRVDAIERIADVGPWYLLSGELVFASKAALISVPRVPINTDEYGARVSDQGTANAGQVWTGTKSGGVADERTCNGFTTLDVKPLGMWGWATVTDSTWTEAYRGWCGDLRRLYCFEE